jgi:hypothetical protein
LSFSISAISSKTAAICLLFMGFDFALYFANKSLITYLSIMTGIVAPSNTNW